MERSCAICKNGFVVSSEEEAFILRMAFRFGKKEFFPPLPTICSDCRTQKRVSHRNDRFLYKNRSSFSGKDIVSIYAPEPIAGEPLKMYSQAEWKSDAWDPMTYGRDYDFNRSFFNQFAALQRAVPRMALISLGNENSGFTTGTGYCKNCYLINSSEYCEDCYYGKLLQRCKNSVDCSYLYDSDLCYEAFSCTKCYGCQWLAHSQNCQECFFSSNLRGCHHCCLCTNLNHKEYHFMNQPLSKEEYMNCVVTFRGSLTRTKEMQGLWKDAMRMMVHKYANILNCENCTGDAIENSRNCIDCYDVTDGQDCRSLQVGVEPKDIYHSSNMYVRSELCYETLGTIEAHTVAYCLYVFHSQRLLYCEYCFNCSDCFGCSGLTRKKHCIFNKQYTEEAYEALVPKIIAAMQKSGEFGQFFPISLSPFGYNESLADEYFPLTEERARSKGFLWREKDIRDFRPQTAAVPENIGDVPESITQEVLSCSGCRRNYRIIPQELVFYRQQIVPVPTLCPDCRYVERLKLRNPRKLWGRKCAKCNKEIQSTYSPDRMEIVVCEECYRKEVY
jgi:hypothetical protein